MSGINRHTLACVSWIFLRYTCTISTIMWSRNNMETKVNYYLQTPTASVTFLRHPTFKLTWDWTWTCTIHPTIRSIAPSPFNKNVKVVGEFKDKLIGVAALEFVGVKAEMYSLPCLKILQKVFWSRLWKKTYNSWTISPIFSTRNNDICNLLYNPIICTSTENYPCDKEIVIWSPYAWWLALSARDWRHVVSIQTLWNISELNCIFIVYLVFHALWTL